MDELVVVPREGRGSATTWPKGEDCSLEETIVEQEGNTIEGFKMFLPDRWLKPRPESGHTGLSVPSRLDSGQHRVPGIWS